MNPKKDIIIISEGGCMSGVFGAGVFSAFQTFGLEERIDSIYAASAGAANAAFFLGGDTFLGATIYYQDFIDNHFIKKDKISTYFYELYEHLLHKEKKIESVVDIDYLVDIITHKKKISAEQVTHSDIDFYIRVLNLETLSFDYLHAKKDVIEDMQASCAIAPFYSKIVTIKGKKYVDGSLISNKEFLDIIKAHPEKQIIYIINHRDKTVRQRLHGLRLDILQAGVLWMVYGRKLARKVLYNRRKVVTKKDIREFPNVYPIINKYYIESSCTQQKKLWKTYMHGMMQGVRCLRKIGIPFR